MAIAWVQTAPVGTGIAGVAPAATLGTPAVAGDLLVSVATWQMNSAITAPSGWTAGTSVTAASPTTGFRMAWTIAAGGETTVTWGNTGQVWVCELAEYSGIDTTPLDVENAAVTASSTLHTTPTVTPASGVERLIVFALMYRRAGSWGTEQVNTSATGVTERAEGLMNTTTLALCDLIVASTSGSYTARGTGSGAAVAGAAGIAIFAAVSAAAAAPPLERRSFIPVMRAATR